MKKLNFDVLYRLSFPGGAVASDKKRTKILHTVIREIASRGVSDLNLGVLARRLKMSRSHLRHYFPSIEKLLEAVVRVITSTAQKVTIDTISEGQTFEQRLVGSVHASFTWSTLYPEQMKCMLMFFFYTGFDPGLRKLSDGIREVGARRLAAMLAAEESLALSEAEARRYALKIQALITGHLIAPIVHPSGGENASAAENCVDTLQSLLSGLRGLRSGSKGSDGLKK